MIMTLEYEIPDLRGLKREQDKAQSTKCRERLLSEYNHRQIFSETGFVPMRTSAMIDIMYPYCGDEPSLERLVCGLIDMSPNGQCHWAEMGGGRAFAMREMAMKPDMLKFLTMTNVDLDDPGFHGPDSQRMIDQFEKKIPGISAKHLSPNHLYANVETVQLPTPADLITSVENIQYLNAPLEAITNWYNQLNDDGFLIVARESRWSEDISYEDGRQHRFDDAPTGTFLRELVEHGINLAAVDQFDTLGNGRYDFDPNKFDRLVIQKKPGTELRFNGEVAKVDVIRDYKFVSYKRPDASRPFVEVVDTSR